MRFSIFLILMLQVLSVFGQNKTYTTNNSNAVSWYEKANVFIDQKDYKQAITALQNAVNTDKNFIEAHFQLADVYKLQMQYKQAVEHYLQVIRLKPEFSRAVYLKAGESEINIADYVNAKMHLEKYIANPNIPIESSVFARKLIRDCVFSINAIKNPVPFKPANLGPEINTANDEYLPVTTADEGTLIFTRKIDNNEDFYQSCKVNSKWTNATYLSRQINTADYNEGAQAISQDGKFLFFTGCNRPDGLGRCDIYISQRVGNDWSKPFNLGAPVNTGGWESQPSLSADGQTMYFVSNRAGGYGGYDIWKCSLTNKGWSQPENLGPNVNTAYDEQSPYIHPDDSTLYFCSNGWPGLGNKDLFISRLDGKGNWRKPENLGYPINSAGDENGMTIGASGTYAFFASNVLKGYGGYDIYCFELPEQARPQPVIYVKGNVTDAATKQPLDANVEITDLERNQIVYQSNSTPPPGDFMLTLAAGRNYGLTISKNGYLFYSENFSLKDHSPLKSKTIEVLLDPIEIGKKAVLGNIFFDTNQFKLKSESQSALQKLMEFMNLNPAVRIEVSGHTDNMGNDKLNQTLSENRAKAVYNYLISNGVNATRLEYKGYGKLQPVAPNTDEEGRSKNRRTEFKVIGK